MPHANNRSLVSAYTAVLRDEPKVRAYVLATLVDAVGIAVSIWAAQLIMASVFVDQRTRASLVIPTLVSSLLGTLVAGPLADWVARRHGVATDMTNLAAWRWRLIVWARLVETVALATLLYALSRGTPTVASLLPYFIVSSFMKTALSGARVALEVDLLRTEELQRAEDGAPLRDERGAPLVYKVHLLTLTAMLGAIQGIATMTGLLLGDRIVALTGGEYWPLFAFDVATNLVFIALVFFGCHPSKRARDVRVADLWRAPVGGERTLDPSARAGAEPILPFVARRFVRSLAEVVTFLRAGRQRRLLWFMIAAWMLELFGEFYDGTMILKHTLGATDHALWRSEVLWSIASLLPAFLLPWLARGRGVAHVGKLFLLTVFLDGLVIAFAGRAVDRGGSSIPFVAALALDRALTISGKTLVALVQNSASSAAMRGRLAAVFGIVVLGSNILAESTATVVAEELGIPTMLSLVGAAQIGAILVIAFAGGRTLWRFGLHTA